MSNSERVGVDEVESLSISGKAAISYKKDGRSFFRGPFQEALPGSWPFGRNYSEENFIKAQEYWEDVQDIVIHRLTRIPDRKIAYIDMRTGNDMKDKV